MWSLPGRVYCFLVGHRLSGQTQEPVEQGETVDTQEYARQIATVPLCFQPGERWMYGYSADILGGVIEIVSGKRFGQF